MAPVYVGAKVRLEWSALGSVPKRELTADANYNFAITGIQGKGISVDVGAPGYRRKKTASRSFEYSSFGEWNFHVPDKNSPVVFELWKLENAEPIYRWTVHKNLKTNGEKVWFDLTNGKFGASGDFAVSTTRGETYAHTKFDYTLTVEAAPGGGLVLRNEEMMFAAPDQGYQPSWMVQQFGKDPSFDANQKVRFYLRTANGKYAAIQAEYSQYPNKEAELRASIYFNPSGSQNLQYDGKKRINKKSVRSKRDGNLGERK